MPFPDDFPLWAKVITYTIVAVGLGIAILIGRLGLLQGRKTSPAANPGAAQVAAVIVDPTALNRATAAVEGLNMQLMQLDAVGKSMARASASEARSVTELTKAVGDLIDSIDKLRDEVIRAAK